MSGRSEFARRIGVGEPSYAFITAKGMAARKRDVIAEEGPLRGKVTGFHLDHHDGHVDAHVFVPTVHTTIDRDHPLHPKHPETIHPMFKKKEA